MTPYEYRGIIVPAITPLADPETVDLNALGPFFEHLIRGGVDGIFILGTTGEGPMLTLSQQKTMIVESAKIISGRVPLLAGISGASGAETVELGAFALSAGADAVVAAVPCYLPADSAEEIIDFYTVLAKHFPGKIFVYNMPGMTKIAFSTDLAVKLLEIDGIAGYKDSAGDPDALRQVIARTKHLGKPVFTGPEHLTAEMMSAGAAGGVNGGANVDPALFVRLAAAARTGDIAALQDAQAEVLAFQKIYGTPVTAGNVVRGLKYALSEMGLIRNITAFPLKPLEK